MRFLLQNLEKQQLRGKQMTTQKWIKKQISFARDNIDDIENFKNHLQSIFN